MSLDLCFAPYLLVPILDLHVLVQISFLGLSLYLLQQYFQCLKGHQMVMVLTKSLGCSTYAWDYKRLNRPTSTCSHRSVLWLGITQVGMCDVIPYNLSSLFFFF